MKSWMVFLNKELTEQMRTYKTLIIGLILLLFGIMSPVMAKLMPELLSGMDLGITIQFPEPVVTDAYAQFFKNITQMGMIVVILVFSGVISMEKSKGTAVLMLTKQLSRSAFVLSKFFAAVLLWTVSFGLSSLVCFYYTQVLFPKTQVPGLVFSLFCLWLYVVIMISLTILSSTLFSNPYLCTFGAFAFWFLLMFTTYVPKFRNISPQVLSTWNMSLLTAVKVPGDLKLPIVIGLLLIFFTMLISCYVFKKQEL
ncbi:MAG: ABC transporter permease [Vallitaleaceae bacterium]|nr:ABC transporter permease [Vallitaleaceae bacterium]